MYPKLLCFVWLSLGTTCRRTWQYLLEAFRRFLMSVTQPEGMKFSKCATIWAYYDDMNFLLTEEERLDNERLFISNGLKRKLHIIPENVPNLNLHYSFLKVISGNNKRSMKRKASNDDDNSVYMKRMKLTDGTGNGTIDEQRSDGLDRTSYGRQLKDMPQIQRVEITSYPMRIYGNKLCGIDLTSDWRIAAKMETDRLSPPLTTNSNGSSGATGKCIVKDKIVNYKDDTDEALLDGVKGALSVIKPRYKAHYKSKIRNITAAYVNLSRIKVPKPKLTISMLVKENRLWPVPGSEMECN